MKTRNQIWPIVRLHQTIVDMQPGFAQRPNADNVGVPQLRTNNVSPQGNIDLTDVIKVSVSPAEFRKYAVRKGDVIFNNTNSLKWVGKTAYFDIDDDYVLSNHMTRIRVNTSMLDSEFLARYLHYLWQTKQSGSRAKQWVNQAAIDQTMLAEYEIPLPPLSEQRRIVATLRHADRLRQLRREADGKAQEFLSALFYEMFGDPSINSKEWPVVLVEDLLRSSPHYGTFAVAGEHGAYLTLRVGNIVNDGILFSDKKYINLRDNDYKRFRVHDGDVLLIRAIGSASLLGKCTVYRGSDDDIVFDSHLMRLQFNPEIIVPEYFQACFASKGGRILLSQYTRASAVQYNINTKEIRSIAIPVPPLQIQEDFWRKTRLFDERYKSLVANQNFDILFQSLLAQAFSGELTATWREEREGLESLDVNYMTSIDTLEISSGFRAESQVHFEERLYPVDSIEIKSVPVTRLFEDLSDEQQEVFDLVNSSKGYCTVETLKANSELPLYVIRQGLQLLTQIGLVQAVQLPDRPIRNVVYVPAYRALSQTDQVRELELGLLRNELEKGLML